LVLSRRLVGLKSRHQSEVNNLIPPPKDLGVFLTILEVEGDSFTGRSIEDLSEEFEGVHG